MYVIACAFMWGVALVGEILYWALLTLLLEPLQVQGVNREMALRLDHDYEGGRCVALILPL